MNNSTNNKVVSIYSQEDDFKVLHQMLNSPKQEARRQAKLRRDRRARRMEKALHIGGIFSAGVIFMYLLIHLV